jgi:hypothetical protein
MSFEIAWSNESFVQVMSFWSGHYGFINSTVAIATSPTPDGPFVLAAPITMKGGQVISSTIGLFVDDDNTAYIRYNTRDSPLRHVIEKLTPNWMDTAGQYATIYEKQVWHET